MKTNKFKGIKWSKQIAVSFLMIPFLFVSAVPAGAAATGSFNIGGYWQPPTVGPHYPTDMNTNANWQNIKNAGIETMMAVEGGFTITKAMNENGIKYSNANGVSLYVTDSSIYSKESFTAADYADLESKILPYKNDSRVTGLMIKDEPNGSNLEGFANTYKHAKAFAPNLQYYVNLLPFLAEESVNGWLGTPAGKLSVNNSAARGGGEYVTSTQKLGQTFKMPSGVNYLHSIQLYLDASQWGSNEMLTLQVWNSPAKTTLITQASAWGSGSGTNYPIFTFNKPVTANTTYYWELSHNGGGDNSVGWVTSSTAGTSTNADGAGYINGTAGNFDFYYKMYTSRDNTSAMRINPTATTGDYVTSTSRLGQTFTTPANVNRFMYYIQPYIDPVHWTSGQALTITVWNSPARTQKIASSTLTKSNNGFHPTFYLPARLESNTSYYWELTSNSSSNVGWALYSTTNAYSGGQAYKNGVAIAPSSGQTGDMWFNLGFGSQYENYIDDWLLLSGADFIQFDNYPFKGGTNDDVNYFLNLELIRDRGIDRNVRYGTFLQSMGISDASGYVKYRNPNMNEKRYNVYTHLAYGFKDLYWFTYWLPSTNDWGEIFNNSPVTTNGTLTPAYNEIKTLNGEMKNLGTTLKNLTSRAVYHSGSALPKGTTAIPSSFFIKPAVASEPLQIGYFTNAAGRKYVMLVNRDYNNARTVNFNLNPKPASITEVSKTTGLEVSTGFTYTASTGVLNVSLAKGEGRLFALPAGY